MSDVSFRNLFLQGKGFEDVDEDELLEAEAAAAAERGGGGAGGPMLVAAAPMEFKPNVSAMEVNNESGGANAAEEDEEEDSGRCRNNNNLFSSSLPPFICISLILDGGKRTYGEQLSIPFLLPFRF